MLPEVYGRNNDAENFDFEIYAAIVKISVIDKEPGVTERAMPGFVSNERRRQFIVCSVPADYSASFLPSSRQALSASSSGASQQMTLWAASLMPASAQSCSQLCIHSPSPQP